MRRSAACALLPPSALNLELLRQEPPTEWVVRAEAAGSVSFVERAGVRCAGAHLIIDLHGASKLDDAAFIEAALQRCIDAAGATLLQFHLQRLEPHGIVNAVAALAEGHFSFRSWPESGYAALDVLMCADARPERCIELILEAFAPRRVAIEEILRGRETNVIPA